MIVVSLVRLWLLVLGGGGKALACHRYYMVIYISLDILKNIVLEERYHIRISIYKNCGNSDMVDGYGLHLIRYIKNGGRRET